MPKTKISPENFSKIVSSSVTWAEAMSRLAPHGITARRAAEMRAKRLGVWISQGEERILRTQVAKLESEVKELREQHAKAIATKQVLRGAMTIPPNPPRWLQSKKHGSGIFHGVPLLMFSDLHHDEVVHPAQVRGVNAFDRATSHRRTMATIDKSIYLLKDVFTRSQYPGFVFACMGDLIAGLIHDEIRISLQAPVIKGLLDLRDLLISAIEKLHNAFGRIHIPWVVGNHGRIDLKPRYKDGPYENLEYALGHMLAKHFETERGISFDISDSFETYVKIYNTRLLITHGHQIKGGSGISGPATPWALAEHKLRSRMVEFERWMRKEHQFDVLLFGHFHRHAVGPGYGYISNGSVKGFDEYAAGNPGLSFEPPLQVMLMIHPEHGITFVNRVFCEKSPIGKSGEWLSVPTDVAARISDPSSSYKAVQK